MNSRSESSQTQIKADGLVGRVPSVECRVSSVECRVLSAQCCAIADIVWHMCVATTNFPRVTHGMPVEDTLPMRATSKCIGRLSRKRVLSSRLSRFSLKRSLLSPPHTPHSRYHASLGPSTDHCHIRVTPPPVATESCSSPYSIRPTLQLSFMPTRLQTNIYITAP